jgi:hypothetical protein
MRTGVREELLQIAERFATADQRMHRAAVRGDQGDREAAAWERSEARGDYQAASRDLADLLLLLVRHALEHRPDALRLYLRELLADAIADAVAAAVDATRRDRP